MELVDDSWTKKQLYAECKNRGITGCSGLAKDGLIQTLNEGKCVLRQRAAPAKYGVLTASKGAKVHVKALG